MGRDPTSLAGQLDRLERRYGPPPPPVPRTALDWVLWENAAYLVPDDRRRVAFEALRDATGLRADGILRLSPDALHRLAGMGGMMAERRVDKLRAIATTVVESFGGDLQSALDLPLAAARRALKRFPGIGDPGADKILLFTGAQVIPALESNGLRVLCRLGHAAEGKSYAATYRAGTAALAAHARRGGPWLIRAFCLLRTHGQETCKHNRPRCDECVLAASCPSA